MALATGAMGILLAEDRRLSATVSPVSPSVVAGAREYRRDSVVFSLSPSLSIPLSTEFRVKAHILKNVRSR